MAGSRRFSSYLTGEHSTRILRLCPGLDQAVDRPNRGTDSRKCFYNGISGISVHRNECDFNPRLASMLQGATLPAVVLDEEAWWDDDNEEDDADEFE